MANPCWLFRFDALDGANAAKTLRFSDGEYVDGSNNLYVKRLKNPALMTVSPNDGGNLRVFSSSSIGEVELNNMDGGLDYLADYAVNGRNAYLEYFNGSSVVSYFSGTCSVMRESSGNIFVSLRTLKDALATDHPQTTFAGNNSLPNGVEGVATDIKGNVKPRCYGNVLNQTPVLVNTSLLIYLASIRTSTVIDAAYDRGVTLTKGADYPDLATMQSTAPSAGQYRCYQGYLRLGSSPVGTITVDSHDTSNLAGDVFSAILVERSYTLDTTSKTTLNGIGSIGIVVDQTRKTTDILDEIIKGLGAYYYFSSTTVYAAKFALAVSSTFSLNPWQIEKIERKATGLGSNGLPIASVKIQADKIYTVQNDLDNTAVSTVRVARMLNEYRKTEANSSACLTRNPLAETLKIDSCLNSITDAAAVATSLLNVVSNRVDWVSIIAHVSTLPSLSIGMGITVISDYLGYSAGRLMTLINYELDIKNNSITLDVIG